MSKVEEASSSRTESKRCTERWEDSADMDPEKQKEDVMDFLSKLGLLQKLELSLTMQASEGDEGEEPEPTQAEERASNNEPKPLVDEFVKRRTQGAESCLLLSAAGAGGMDGTDGMGGGKPGGKSNKGGGKAPKAKSGEYLGEALYFTAGAPYSQQSTMYAGA